MTSETTPTILLTGAEVQAAALQLATEIRRDNAISGDVRKRFVSLRAALFQQGIYDPVLGRFDSATAPPVSPERLATQLEAIAASIAK